MAGGFVTFGEGRDFNVFTAGRGGRIAGGFVTFGGGRVFDVSFLGRTHSVGYWSGGYFTATKAFFSSGVVWLVLSWGIVHLD